MIFNLPPASCRRDLFFQPFILVSPILQVTIIVNDINDNTPQFVDPPQSTSISEAARPGSNVIQVPAVDKDLGFAGKVFYNITEGNSNGMLIEYVTFNDKTLMGHQFFSAPILL